MQNIINRLSETANELYSLASALGTIAPAAGIEILANSASNPSSTGQQRQGDLLWAHLAARTYEERRTRDRIFNDPTLFGEPAWDILLDLLLAEEKGKRLSVTSACIGASVPATTALRWISVLEERGLVRRENDAIDRRRAFVRMTDGGIRKMRSYFAAI